MAKAAPLKKKLTEASVRKAQAKPNAYLVWDTVQAGFALRVETSGHKSFKAIYKTGGRARWYHIGAVEALKLDEARRLAGRVMFQVAEGADPQAQRLAARSSGSFEDIAKKYAAYAEGRNKSWRQADALVKRHLLPRWGKMQAAAITRGDVRAMMRAIPAPIVANQTLAGASAIFSWAIKEEVGNIKLNPCHGVERNPTRERERVLSDTELPRFWAAFGEAGMRGMALKMILLTGARPGEVQHMRTEHIVGDWWELPGAPVPALRWPGLKNGRSHRIFLSAPARAIIAELGVEGEGFVFGGERGGVVSRLEGAMAASCEQLDVERATPHDLRRSFGTLVTGMGFGTQAMDRILNHADRKASKITGVYDRYSYSVEDQRIMEAVAARIMELVAGRPSASNVVALR